LSTYPPARPPPETTPLMAWRLIVNLPSGPASPGDHAIDGVEAHCQPIARAGDGRLKVHHHALKHVAWRAVKACQVG
jgi:hypothetical protein